MNYFELYPGDYRRDTARLSLAEHGAYTLLLADYYAGEKALPAPYADLYRITGAQGAAEQKAVRLVADTYFPIAADDGLRHNSRADREIEKAQRRINAARQNGSKGGRKPEPNKNPAGNPAGSQTGTQRDTQRDTQQGTQPGEALQTPHATSQESQVTTTPSLPITSEAAATEAGRACLLMRQAGCGLTNPSHKDLLDALAQGITPETLGHFAKVAVEKGKTNPFAYAITAAKNDRASTGTVTPIKPKANDNFQGKTYVGTPDDQLPASLR